MAKSIKLLISAFIAIILTKEIKCNIDISNFDLNSIKDVNVTEQLANINITQRIDDTKRLLEEKCKKVSNDPDAFNNIQEGGTKLYECMTHIVNVTKIQEEIEEARPHGRLDEVFNKYCKKRPEAMQCFEEFETTLKPCMDEEEKGHYETLMRIFKSILNFVCYKGGDQIALFIAEKGPECLNASKEEIGKCLNNTFGGYIPKEGFESLETLPKFVIGPKQCDDIQAFEKCTVKVLEKCEDITPANIIESMFKFIKNETVCATPKSSAQLGGNSANTLVSNARITLLLGMIFTILYNYF
ncbi:27 kDa hemolymph glycoprotein-like [Condylostylus longicornis]|uniref:27 kDa hemolymph glycoprotein-like n=1 Tax=Condylostylus longicornis TaxID=2530218 RepID=UPI00244DD43B|nr:27 kDa hemolymph glycoprotein-like [Condylostylus longicornis]